MVLAGKNILLISPQPWGGLFVSKHHYAVALARRGNNVYFLCPIPLESNRKTQITIAPIAGYERLFLIEHTLRFPFQIKFHLKGLFHSLMRMHVKRILRAVKYEFDIVWSFDLGDYFPFRFFSNKTLRVFHPVDEPLNQTAIAAAQGSHVIFSVTAEILSKYELNPAPKFLIHHGVDAVFLKEGIEVRQKPIGEKIRVGFSGNLRRKDIDRTVFLKIVRAHPDVIFECFGAYTHSVNHRGKDEMDTEAFVSDLKKLSNVQLNGLLSPDKLASAYKEMDAFLICYDVARDQSGGTNYHKITEFLSTGKVVISNNVTAYANRPDLVQMVPERDNNSILPSLFRKVISNLSEYNAPSSMHVRMAYARENSYDCQIDKIESILSGLKEI